MIEYRDTQQYGQAHRRTDTQTERHADGQLHRRTQIRQTRKRDLEVEEIGRTTQKGSIGERPLGYRTHDSLYISEIYIQPQHLNSPDERHRPAIHLNTEVCAFPCQRPQSLLAPLDIAHATPASTAQRTTSLFTGS